MVEVTSFEIASPTRGEPIILLSPVEVASPMRGEPAILLSPDVDERGGDDVLFMLESEDELET